MSAASASKPIRYPIIPMKITSPSFLGGLVLASFLSLTTFALAGDPITGVDVKLGKNPGGALVARDKTDAKGQVTFANLPPGDYVVSYVELLPAPARGGQIGGATNPTQQKAAIITSRSNKKHSNINVVFTNGHAKSALKEAPHTVDWGDNGKETKVAFTVPAGQPQGITLTVAAPESDPAQKINSTLSDISTTR
jgi:hypothetical protein